MDPKNAKSGLPHRPDQTTGSDMPDATLSAASLEQRLDRVVEVRTRVLDTIDGFGKIAERAEPEFLPVAHEFLAMHQEHDRGLAGLLTTAGYGVEKGGSIFGAVNRGLIEARSWFDKVDSTMIDSIIEGEKHVLQAYEQSLAEPPSEEAERLLGQQMIEIDAMLGKHTR